MKKQILFILFILLTFQGFSQSLTPEFEFQLYFEDAAGNKDTLTLGYDALATDSIDTAFGEVNYLDSTFNTSIFQVFISDGFRASITNENETFRLKKQIVKKHCSDSWSFWDDIFIDFKNAVFPIRIDFDYNNLIQNECTKGSIISAIEPNILWDAGGYKSNMHIFTDGYLIVDTIGSANQYDIGTSDDDFIYCFYNNIDDETVYSLWFKFAGNDLLTLSTKTESAIEVPNIYPNPNDGDFYIDIPFNEQNVIKIQIIDNVGKIVFESSRLNGNKVSISNPKKGIYFVSVLMTDKISTHKIIIQ